MILIDVMSEFKCKWCDLTYCHRSSKYRHEKLCDKRTDFAKKPVEIKKKPDVYEVLVEIKNDIAKLTLDRTQNHIQINNYNYIIISNTQYQDILTKLGRDEAIRLLSDGKLIDVTKKLYFENISPELYPVACRENLHFRFLNDKCEIIDDKGGDKINQVVNSTMHNAMIAAVNDIITDQLNGKETCNDISTLQKRLLTQMSDQNFRSDLSKMSYNPNHPFFQKNEGSIEYTDH